MRCAVPRRRRRARDRARARAPARAAARRSPGRSRPPGQQPRAAEVPCREASTPLPPRSGSRSRHTTSASTNAGSARMTKARPPRERGDVAGDREAEAGADVLAGEDDAVDPAALPAPEPVADERRDDRAGRGGDGAEEESRPEQLREVRGGRAPEHRGAPGTIVTPRMRRPRHPVGEDAERQRRERADERADRDEQADVGVRDVQARPELARRGAHGRGVGAAQPEDRGEDDDDARALLAAERDREAPPGRAAAAEPMAAASVRTRCARDSSLLTPSWWQAHPPACGQTSRRTRRTAAITIAAAQYATKTRPPVSGRQRVRRVVEGEELAAGVRSAGTG